MSEKLEMEKKLLIKVLKKVNFMPKAELEAFVGLLDSEAVENFLKLYS
jgi:hypothetical protein